MKDGFKPFFCFSRCVLIVVNVLQQCSPLQNLCKICYYSHNVDDVGVAKKVTSRCKESGELFLEATFVQFSLYGRAMKKKLREQRFGLLALIRYLKSKLALWICRNAKKQS